MDCLVEDRYDVAGSLEDLERIRHGRRSRHTADDALAGRVVLALGRAALQVELLGPGLELHLASLEILRDVANVAPGDQPEAGQIRFAIRQPRRRRRQVWFAISSSWNARRR